jgi:hypothetical protein
MNTSSHISKSPLEYQRIKSIRDKYKNKFKRTLDILGDLDELIPRYRFKSGTPRYGMKTTRTTYRTDRDITDTAKYL